MDAREQSSQNSQVGTVSQVDKFIVWVHPWIYNGKLHRVGGYLAFNLNGEGYPYVSKFNGKVKFFDSFNEATTCADAHHTLKVSGFEVHTIRVSEFKY